MQKKYPVTLSDDERRRLKKMVSSGVAPALAIRRAQILLKCAEGETDAAVSKAVGASETSVFDVRRRFTQVGVDDTVKGGGGRIAGTVQKALDGKKEAQLVALACSQPPAGHERWSLRLLASAMIELKYVDGISPETIRQALKKMNLSLG
jgi:hypothetical protein